MEIVVIRLAAVCFKSRSGSLLRIGERRRYGESKPTKNYIYYSTRKRCGAPDESAAPFQRSMSSLVILFETPETTEITMLGAWFYSYKKPAPNRDSLFKLDSYQGFKDYCEAQAWRV